MKKMTLSSRVICILLVVFLSLSGMCSDVIKADSSFGSPVLQHSMDVLQCADQASIVTDTCTNELLGSQVHKLSSNMVIRSHVALSRIEVRPALLEFHYHIIIHLVYEITYFRDVILSYIHHQDGEKG